MILSENNYTILQPGKNCIDFTADTVRIFTNSDKLL